MDRMDGGWVDKWMVDKWMVDGWMDGSMGR